MEQINPIFKNIFEQQQSTPSKINVAQPKVDIGGAKIKQLKSDKFDYSVDDGKISLGDKLKNFAKGLVKPITAMFSSTKNFLIGAGMIAAGAAVTIATGGAAAPVFVALGVAGGAIQLCKGIYNASKAKTDDEAKAAWQGIGAGTSAVGMSVIGSKGALKGAGVDTKGMGFLKSTIECFKQVPSSVSKSVNSFTSGKAFTNIKNIFSSKKTINTEQKAETKPKTEAKPETKPKTEAKPETKPKTEAKPETKPKVEQKAETKPNLEQKTEAKADQKFEPESDKFKSKAEELKSELQRIDELSKETSKLISDSHNMTPEDLRMAIDKLDDTYGLEPTVKDRLEGLYNDKIQKIQEVHNAYNDLISKSEKMTCAELQKAIADRQSGWNGTKFSPEQEATLQGIYEKKYALMQEQLKISQQESYTSKIKTAQDVVKNHMEELDKILLDEQGKIKYFTDDGTAKASIEEIVKPFDKDLGTIYHGTKAESKASILKDGFSEKIAPEHGYKDGVGGTYFTREKTNMYGDSVIEARFTGKVGQADTDVLNNIKTYISNNMKVEKFVNGLGQYDKSSISSEAIIQQYLRQKIADLGYQGIMGTNYSYRANCRYFTALDPSLIQIIS